MYGDVAGSSGDPDSGDGYAEKVMRLLKRARCALRRRTRRAETGAPPPGK